MSESRLIALLAHELRTLAPLSSGQLAARLLLDQPRVKRCLVSESRFQRVGHKGSDLWALNSEAPHVA